MEMVRMGMAEIEMVEMVVTIKDVLTRVFLACKPKDFDGKGGAIALTRWIEKMLSVMDISGYERGCKTALGMTWEEFKAFLVEAFCPSNEMEKLESEFLNYVMVEPCGVYR
nr:reverse transcriptase domain-containing protein [Tanacetum cinerariifolium]